MKTCATPLSRRPWKSSLALGAAALGSQGAQGAVVYNDFADVVNSSGDYNFSSVQLDPGALSITAPGSPGIDNKFFFRAVEFSKYSIAPARILAFLGTNPVAISILGAGVLVNSSIAFAFGGGEINPGANLSNVFVGVRLYDSANGNINYGWIRYSTGADVGGGVGPGTITIHDAAFESNVNQGILTGQTTSIAVPEPSRALLLALAGGAMALRRRRQAMAA